jgi:hypothetical protein
MLIGVLVLPYIFMDQSENFNNMLINENYSNSDEKPKMVETPTKIVIEQPKITLNENEKIENLKAVEEINNKKYQEKQEQEKQEKTFTLEQVQTLLNHVSKQKTNQVIENYGSMYTGDVKKEYNENEKFTNQLLKPLGENGNGFTNEWDHDYILLNTDKWAPALNPPPVCKSEQKCPVCPNLTTGYPLMLRDFDSTRRVTPPIKADVSAMNNSTYVPTPPSM